eukprot:3682586-Amphidinium_carterae.1
MWLACQLERSVDHGIPLVALDDKITVLQTIHQHPAVHQSKYYHNVDRTMWRVETNFKADGLGSFHCFGDGVSYHDEQLLSAPHPSHGERVALATSSFAARSGTRMHWPKSGKSQYQTGATSEHMPHAAKSEHMPHDLLGLTVRLALVSLSN